MSIRVFLVHLIRPFVSVLFFQYKIRIIQTQKFPNLAVSRQKSVGPKKPPESVFFKKLFQGYKNECEAIYKLPEVVYIGVLLPSGAAWFQVDHGRRHGLPK